MCHRNSVVMQCCALALLTTLALALGGCGDADSVSLESQTKALPGAMLGDSGFVSADAPQDQPPAEKSDATTGALEDDQTPGRDERTVEEGDIYRVLGGNLILNLNTYRGLQIINLSDVENPQIIGRLQVGGSPVELYVVDDYALVLLNNWVDYYGTRDDISVEARSGGMALSVDLSDPTAPEIIDQAYIPGYIRKTRLTGGDGQAALYVAAGGWDQWENEDGEWEWESHTYVTSFDVSGGALQKKGEVNLGGYIADIQATSEVLMVARNDWNWSDSQSRVAVVDISDPTGVMVMGDQVTTEGWINNQFNMDYYNGVLRVVSGSRWGSDRANWVQTFDARDLGALRPIDHCEFAAGEGLFAAVFLEDRAFFGTHSRTGTLHRYLITAEGVIRPGVPVELSGWDDFFRSVMDETRLLGIGVNDEGSRTLAVSLYDITVLTNPEPLIARENVEFSGSWSEARWDHRAFSVLEDAVAIAGPDGVVETGMVLLPFSGWNDYWHEYTAAVQIFTFSETTLTRRGLMLHGTPVRRSFEADHELVANLSEAALSLFDTTDPEDPVELGRVELAPNYTDVLVYGDYIARRKDPPGPYPPGDPTDMPSSTVEIVPLTEDPDIGTAVASFEIPSDATVYQTGDTLVTAEFEYLDTTEWPYTYETTLTVYDLTNPPRPRPAATLVTDRLKPTPRPTRDSRVGNRPEIRVADDNVHPVPGGLVFLQRHPRRKLIGVETVCVTNRRGQENCREYERYRYWEHFTLEVLDLTDPDEPSLAETVDLGARNEGVSMLVDGSDVWVTYKRPVDVDPDDRPLVRYFIQQVDLTDVSEPVLGEEINVPGELLAVDGETIFTQDVVWGETVVETAIARLVLFDGLAYLEAIRRLQDRNVQTVALDGNGNVLVSHRLHWRIARERGVPTGPQILTILDAASDDLTILSETIVARKAKLRDALVGRALFQVPGGLLIFNTDSAWLPYAQAYFPTRGWSGELTVVDRRIIFAAGRYGIYDLDLDSFNLLERPD